MRTLKQILREFYVPADVLGEEVNREAFVKELKECKKNLNKLTWLLAMMILFLYFLSIGITLFYLKEPETITKLFSAIGISIIWPINQMSKLWKEVAQVNLMIVLCMTLEPTEIHNIIKTLIESGFTNQKSKP